MKFLIHKEEIYNLDMNYIANNFIRNGDVKQENVPRWGNQRLTLVQVTISIIYYRFIVRFTIGLEFQFITFLL